MSHNKVLTFFIIFQKEDFGESRSGYDIALNGEKRNHVYVRKTDGDFEVHLVALSYCKPLKDTLDSLYGYCPIESSNSIISIASPMKRFAAY